MEEQDLRAFVSECRMLIALMLVEIETQVAKASASAARLDILIGIQNGRGNADAIWHDLQALAEAAASISRIIKPSLHTKRSAAARALSHRRGLALRALLDIQDDHAILARNMRNRLVHLDEDIDDWWLSSKRHIISRRSMGDVDNIFGGVEENEIFEHFNYRTRDFIYRGERFSTIAMWQSIVDVSGRIRPARLRIRDDFGLWVPELDE